MFFFLYLFSRSLITDKFSNEDILRMREFSKSLYLQMENECIFVGKAETN